MSDATTTSGARQGLESTSCSLTAFLSLAFICAGIMLVVVIVGLAVWLPIEIQRDGETLKERNDLYFKANAKGEPCDPNERR